MSGPDLQRSKPISQIIVVTGASSGFGAMTVRALASAGHTVYAGIRDTAGRNAPADADPTTVAAAIVRVVDTPKGKRPFRVHIDPADDGAEQVNALGDRVRRDFYARIGLEDLLSLRTGAASIH